MRTSYRRPVLSVPTIFVWHCLMIAALVGAHLATKVLSIGLGHRRLLGVADIFDLDKEAALHTVVATASLLSAALVCAVIAATENPRNRGMAAGWLFVSTCLLFMMFDEGAMLHDRLSAPIKEGMDGDNPFYFVGWLIPYVLITVVVAAVAVPFALRLPRITAGRLLVAALLYLGSALGMEMIQGHMIHQLVIDDHLTEAAAFDRARSSWPMVLSITVEEAGELLAVALALRASALHLVSELGADLPRLSDGRTARAPVYDPLPPAAESAMV